MTERSKKLDLAMGPSHLALISVSRGPWALGYLGRITNWLEQLPTDGSAGTRLEQVDEARGLQLSLLCVTMSFHKEILRLWSQKVSAM